MRNSGLLVFREVGVAVIWVQRWVSLFGAIVEISVLALEASRVRLIMYFHILATVPRRQGSIVVASFILKHQDAVDSIWMPVQRRHDH